MAGGNARSRTASHGKTFLGILILFFLAFYSSTNWIESLFISPPKAIDDGHQRNYAAVTTTDLRGNNATLSSSTPEEKVELPLCEPFNTTAAKEKLVCLPACKPYTNRTLEGLGLDPNERINITVRDRTNKYTGEYGKYRIHYPEENVHLDVINPLERGKEWAPRSATERLFRRIIAKLFRAGVLDPSQNIINTGSWIGDNALPWALMLEQLTSNPGTVIAVDPSEKFVQNMVDIANTNSISNLCARVTVYSSEARTIFTGKVEHLAVNLGKKNGIELKALTVDSEGFDNVTLIHLDVEGHEGELLLGARKLIQSSRPVVVTEGVTGLTDSNDKKVAQFLGTLGYNTSSEIPEVCGWAPNCRNHIWWPDKATETAALAVIGDELQKSVIPWVSFD